MKFSRSAGALLLGVILISAVAYMSLFGNYDVDVGVVPPPCFVVENKTLCINAIYRSGSIRSTKDGSTIRLNADNLFASSAWVRVHISRYGNHRDDPGAELYDYAVAAPGKKRFGKIGEDREYVTFKNLTDSPGRDSYLFVSKISGEKFIYRCMYARTCSFSGTYNGCLLVDVSFNTDGLNRRDLKLLRAEFTKFKSTLIQGGGEIMSSIALSHDRHVRAHNGGGYDLLK